MSTSKCVFNVAHFVDVVCVLGLKNIQLKEKHTAIILTGKTITM